MKKIFPILAVFVVLFLTATAAFSQQRINFKRGAQSTIVTGNLNGYRSKKVYLLRVRRGQRLSVEQIKPDASVRYVTLSLKAPNGEDVTDSDASCNNRKRVAPTRAGDYRITVTECQKADPWRGNFRLKISIKN